MRRLTTRDLINIGIFTVLYFAAVAIFGQVGALVPILQVLGPLYIPIVAGIPFMLFLTRVDKFGMITIMGILVGLLVLATGQAYWSRCWPSSSPRRRISSAVRALTGVGPVLWPGTPCSR